MQRDTLFDNVGSRRRRIERRALGDTFENGATIVDEAQSAVRLLPLDPRGRIVRKLSGKNRRKGEKDERGP